MSCIDLTSKRSKQLETSKEIKLRWICIDLFKTTQNNKRDQITMNLHRFDVKSIQNVELRSNAFKITQNYKSNQITMTCIDLMSKHWKLQKWSKYKDLHRFHVKPIKTTQKYKSYQITMTCIDLMSKHWKLQKWSKYKDLHRFHVKPIKTTQKYKSDQITMSCIDLTSKPSIMMSYVAKNIRKSAKLRKWSKFASIWCQNDQNNSKVQKRSNYNELHRFDVITIKNVELRRKTFKTTQNYKSNQITMTCIDLMSKHSKLQNWSKYKDLHRFHVKPIKTAQTYKSD